MDYQEIRKMSRSDICFYNVATFKILHPRLYIQKVVVQYFEKSITVRLFYFDERLNKRLIHNYNFFISSEAIEAENFVSLIRNNFPSLPIETVNE